MGNKVYKSVVQVPEVLGGLDLSTLMEGEAGEEALVLRFPTMREEEGVEGRRQILGETGEFQFTPREGFVWVVVVLTMG